MKCDLGAALLKRDDLQVLRRWLASRYERPAFPNSFDRQLKVKKLDRKLEELGIKHGHLVSGLLFDLTPENGVYQLGIVVLYVAEPDPLIAFQQAQIYAEEITKAFEGKLFDPATETWKLIELQYCFPISEDDLTLSKARNFQRWNLDAVSYAAEPQQELMPD